VVETYPRRFELVGLRVGGVVRRLGVAGVIRRYASHGSKDFQHPRRRVLEHSAVD
jgi:hypothetical protein